MSPSHIVGVAIPVCPYIVSTLCPLLPTGGSITPTASTISTLMTPTPESSMDLPSHSTWCLHNLLVMGGVGAKKERPSCWNQWWPPKESLYYTLCLYLFENFHYKEIFKKEDPSEPWGKNSKEKHSIKNRCMRGILSSFEENNSLHWWRKKKNWMAASYLNNKSYILINSL